MEFEWDPKKAALNFKKHGVTFQEGSSVFADEFARIIDDPVHSITEYREIIIGTSSADRLLFVSFTVRSGRARIISARRANRLERQDHEDQKSKQKTNGSR